MNRVERLEREIEELTPAELAAFRSWFLEYNADEWDRRIEEDALAGRLDEPARRALREHEAGNTTEL